jgi:hypothetical protein
MPVDFFLLYWSDLDANMRFNLKHGMLTTGTNSPFELIQGSKKYSVKGIAGSRG